jgi:hypothetical protein
MQSPPFFRGRRKISFHTWWMRLSDNQAKKIYPFLNPFWAKVKSFLE